MQRKKRTPNVTKNQRKRENPRRKKIFNTTRHSTSVTLSEPAAPLYRPPPVQWPPRILMIIDQFNIGGTETYTLSLTRELIRSGAVVAVAGKRGKIMDSFIGLGCPYYEVDFVLDNYEPDVQNAKLHLDVLKMIISTERIQIIHAHQYPSGELAKRAAEEMNIPFVFTVHGCYYDASHMQKLKLNTTFVSVSPAIEHSLNMDGITSHLIPNGLDAVEFSSYPEAYQRYLRSKLGIPNNAFVVMYVGRLTWEKADICKDVIQATSALRKKSGSSIVLLIVGGGIHQEQVEKLVKQERHRTGDSFIIYPGEMLNMRACYAISDCVIGTGRIALEAMACQRPLICSGSKGYLGVVDASCYEQAWNSWFGDHHAANSVPKGLLTAHIERIWNMDFEEKNAMVQSGRTFVMQRFHVAQITSKMLDVYRQLLFPKRD